MLYLISDFLIMAELFFYFCALFNSLNQVAAVAELVDALDSKSSSFESVGSIPTRGTFIFLNLYCISTAIKLLLFFISFNYYFYDG